MIVLFRVALPFAAAMFGATAFADPPIINGGEAPQIGRARVYDQTGIPVYTYRILATYPHDIADYTEALFVDDGYLYEGTGQYGKSLLKKSRLATGEVVSRRALDQRFFGEGAVALNGKVYHLTYISNTGFIYDQDDLSPERSFEYPRQGWGLTTDGESLIASDGSAVVLFLDPETLAIRRSIIVKDGYGAVGFLNELEYVDGHIYANVWQTDYLVRFSAETGSVDGWIDLDGLNPNPVKLVYPHVLNGIAYDGEPGTLLVTGKNWPSIWRVELVPVAHKNGTPK